MNENERKGKNCGLLLTPPPPYAEDAVKPQVKGNRNRFFNLRFSPRYTILGCVFAAFFLAYCAADGSDNEAVPQSSGSSGGPSDSGEPEDGGSPSPPDAPKTDLDGLPETISDLKFDFLWRTKRQLAADPADAGRPQVSWNDTDKSTDGAGYSYLLRYAFNSDLDDTSHSTYAEKRFAAGASTGALTVDDIKISPTRGGGFFSFTRLWHFQIVKRDAANRPVSRSKVQRAWIYEDTNIGSPIMPSVSIPFGRSGKSTSFGFPAFGIFSLQSKMNFMCWNTGNNLAEDSVSVQTANMYWMMVMTDKKAGIDRLDVSADNAYFDGSTVRSLLLCDKPSELNYFPILFAQHTAEENGLKFCGGETLGLVFVGDGTESDITSDLSGDLDPYVVRDASSDATKDIHHTARNNVNPGEAGYSPENYRMKILIRVKSVPEGDPPHRCVL